MSSLSLLNSSESISFLVLTAIFLFISPAIFVGIIIMYGNLKQKISNELSACVIKIVNDFGTENNILEIEKRPLCDQIFTELNDKLIAKVDACISDVNSSFTAKFGRIYAEINSKLTMKAEKNKARDDDFTRKAQKIFSMVNNIITKVNNIEACRNEFSRINVVIKNL